MNVVTDLLKENNISITGVLHIGAHECEELSFYIENFPLSSKDIIWIEADKKKCEENTRRGVENVYHSVISETDNECLTFHVSNNKQSSSILELGTHKIHHPDIRYVKDVKVKSITVDTFFSWVEKDPKKYNFWNIDIQGAEMMALRGGTHSIEFADAIYIEVTTERLYTGCSTLNEMDSYFLGLGFQRIRTEMTKWSWGDALYIRKERILQLATPPVKTHYEKTMQDTERDNMLSFINPFSLYAICDHFIGTEHFKESGSRDISRGKNDILKGYNLSLVKDFDIIHCQVDYLETFMDVFMPKIDKLIVLTTGQWHLPQLHKSDLTERVLNHPQIVLWFSQNPIYEQSEKYIAFPYGLKHHYLNHYCQVLRQSSEEKEFDISCLYLGKTHPCRSKFPPSSKKPLPPKEYFTLLKKSKITIRPFVFWIPSKMGSYG